MATILITGAKGQLGSEIRSASSKIFGHNFIFTDVDTLDLTDGVKVQGFIKDHNPDWIVNCAAYNNVDKAEDEPEAARMVNALAVKNIVSVIRDTPARLIHLSSDYVFDGKSKIPYKETDKTNPVSVYGRSKLDGEKAALLHPYTIVLRTSWLYSSYGHNFVKTILKAAKEKKQLRVVNDQTGCPTYAADLASAILGIITSTNSHQIAFNAGIFNYSNEGACSWHEFAEAILAEAGIDAVIEAVPTSEYPHKAERPAYSVLSKVKITENYRLAIPHWRTSLKNCIKQINK